MRNARHVIGAALTAAAALGALSGPAGARGLHITLAVPAQTNAGAPIRIVYTSVGIPMHASLVIQRQMGTRHTYRTVMTLAHSRRAAAKLPALPMGIYTVRIAVIKGSMVIPDPPATLHVYGNVPFSSLLSNADGFGQGTLTTATGTFDYVLTHQPGYAPNNGINTTTIPAARNHCRSVHVEFVLGDVDLLTDALNAEATLSVVQASADPVTATSPYETVGSVDAAVQPGQSWGLVSAQLNGDRAHHLYINGSASCWSADAA